MTLFFYKYHGTGNDFILIDHRQLFFKPEAEVISRLCCRRLGIGADGLMLLENKAGYDFSMRYFNSDGSEGSMCGNGGRCIVAFASMLGICSNRTRFSAIDGDHEAEIISAASDVFTVKLKMKDVHGISRSGDDFFVDTGSPHVVRFVENADHQDVFSLGREIRHDAHYAPEGTNVNFVNWKGDQLYVRTYERGVEDETLSCGTGVTASAIAAAFVWGGNAFNIVTKGGSLSVGFSAEKNDFTNIWLTGPAVLVYKGQKDI